MHDTRFATGLRATWPALALCLILLLGPATGWARKVALLVGVGAYPELDRKSQLEGPSNDVAALRDVLIRRWGFVDRDIVTLVDAQATRGHILREIRALQERSTAGDEVLLYLSGHGTSAFDARLQLALPHGSGAFAPSDFKLDADMMQRLIIGRRDLLPLLSALDEGGRQVWMISDSCYAGQQVRSIQGGSGTGPVERMIPLPPNPKMDKEQKADLDLAAQGTAPPPYPYRRVAFLAAAAEGERALDIGRAWLGRMPTIDGKAHGAFTDALLRVLEGQIAGDLDGDGALSLAEVHRATSDFMAGRAYAHTPQRLPSVAEDGHGLGQRPVLQARGAAAPWVRAPARPLRVLATGLATSLAPEAQALLRAVPDLELLPPDTPRHQADLIIEADGQRLRLLSAGGDRLADLNAADRQALAGQVQQLAWAQRIRQLAEAGRRGALAADIEPARTGGNFKIGESLAFVLRPDRAATLLLLNVSASGGISVLYPYRPAERQPVAAGQPVYVPGRDPRQWLRVSEPLGMDLQFVFAFDTPPPGLADLERVENASPSDPRLKPLDDWLRELKGHYTYAATATRALQP